MNRRQILFLIITTTLLISCDNTNNLPNKTKENNKFSFEITSLTDKEYPDNPDIGFRSTNYQNDFLTDGNIDSTSNKFIFNFSFFTKNSDTILLENVDVSEFIPTIPTRVKSSQYLSYISCVNLEWNRNQVQFNQSEFTSSTPEIIRVDVARNCLNAYLWEVILYVNENGKSVPYAHGWFDFPHLLYAQLFEEKNNIPFSTYQKPLETWEDPENKKIDLNLLRTVLDTVKIEFSDKSDQMYPMEGARKKKFKEIIYPHNFMSMRELQTDSTLFSTFSPPGIYNKQDPRKTELGRIHTLKNMELYRTVSGSRNDTLYEFSLEFVHQKSSKITRLVIGGLTLNSFPTLPKSEANKGWKNSMGIGNHPFYEQYKNHINYKSENSPYYAMLLDENGKWLDSHKVGIDGPLIHFSGTERKILQLWLLSFERHALVANYEIKLN